MRMTAILCLIPGLIAAGCSANLNEGSVRAGAEGRIGAQLVTDAIYRPSSDVDGALTAGDDVMITLLSGYICDFREFGGLFNSGLTTNFNARRCNVQAPVLNLQGQATRGEIVVLAGFHFRDGSANQPDVPEERVIYFNEDVRESGQLLNFANLPVYGPAPYQEAASRLRVSILELDQQEADQQSALLSTLANVGSSFSSPVQGAALSALSKIGEAFLRSNDDDVEFAFDMGFDPGNPDSLVHRVVLREGYLVLMRRETRSATDHFDGVRVCPDRGVIVKDMTCAEAAAASVYYNDNSWLLLRISREKEGVTNAALARTLSALAEAIARPASSTGASDAIEDAIKIIRDATKPAAGG